MPRLGCHILPLSLLGYGDWSCRYLTFHMPEQAHHFLHFVSSAFGILLRAPGSGHWKDRSRLPESGRILGYYLNTGCHRRALSSPVDTRARTHTDISFLFSESSLNGGRSWRKQHGNCLSLGTFCIHGRANYRPKHYWDCTEERCFEGFLFSPSSPWSKGTGAMGDGLN